MRPSNSLFNFAYRWLAYATLFCNFCLGFTFIKKAADVANVAFRQFCGVDAFAASSSFRFRISAVTLAAGYQAGQTSVFAVFKAGNIFKIFQTVVSFITVNVINLSVFWTFAQKGFSHKVMNESVPFLPVGENGDNKPPTRHFYGIKFSIAAAVNYVSKIRNRISLFVTDNGSPFFNFFNGNANLRISHKKSLLFRLKLWLGSQSVGSTLASRFYFTTQEAY